MMQFLNRNSYGQEHVTVGSGQEIASVWRYTFGEEEKPQG